MSIVDRFNKTIEREFVRMPNDQAESLNQAMLQFDALVKAGIVQPDRYNLEPISTITTSRHFSACENPDNTRAT